MKIKNILAILSLGMVSCVGLEQYPTTSYTDETFWTIEDNVRTALYLGYNQCWHQDYYSPITCCLTTCTAAATRRTKPAS